MRTRPNVKASEKRTTAWASVLSPDLDARPWLAKLGKVSWRDLAAKTTKGPVPGPFE
jgi:hypothetical protein